MSDPRIEQIRYNVRALQGTRRIERERIAEALRSIDRDLEALVRAKHALEFCDERDNARWAPIEEVRK